MAISTGTPRRKSPSCKNYSTETIKMLIGKGRLRALLFESLDRRP
jgi:hypothetical protein